jgi:hypothetical protein
MRAIGPVLLFLSLFVGCGPAVDGYSGPRGTVAGRLTIDGKPVREGCQILLMAAQSQGSFVAAGTVEGDGSYKALYRVPAGLPVGDYVVQLSLPRNDTPSVTVGAGDSMTAGDVEQMQRAWKASLPFPQRYLSTSTSGLKLTVQPGVNAANFDITETDQAGKVGK